MKTMPWLLVAALVVGFAVPTWSQNLEFELTFRQLISDVSRIEHALGIGAGGTSWVLDRLDKRVKDLEFDKTLAGMYGKSETVHDGKLDESRLRTVDARISTLESKNDALSDQIKKLEFGNELLQDRLKALEDSSVPRAARKSRVPEP